MFALGQLVTTRGRRRRRDYLFRVVITQVRLLPLWLLVLIVITFAFGATNALASSQNDDSTRRDNGKLSRIVHDYKSANKQQESYQMPNTRLEANNKPDFVRTPPKTITNNDKHQAAASIKRQARQLNEEQAILGNNSSSLGDNLGDSQLASLLARYFHLPAPANAGELTYDDPTAPTKQANDAAGEPNCTSGAGCDIIELPRPTNLSVLMLSYYPPILKLRWNFNEVGDVAVDDSSLEDEVDFYATKQQNGTTKSLNSQANKQDSQHRPSLQLINGTNYGDLESGSDRRGSDDWRIRQQLVKKSLTCFQVVYHVVSSRFKIIEEYPPSWRNITMEWLLPATEYSLRVIALYANRYRLASEPVLFITPSDEKSRRFREGTYRPIHRSPDERREHKSTGGLEHVRNEELTIVAIAIGFWLATIYWFFNKWGKIRMLEPYQPAYREVSPPSTPFGSTHHHPGITSSMHNLGPETGSCGGGQQQNRTGSQGRPSPTSDQFSPAPGLIQSPGNTQKQPLNSNNSNEHQPSSHNNTPPVEHVSNQEQANNTTSPNNNVARYTSGQSAPPLKLAKGGETFDSMDGGGPLGAGMMQIPTPILTSAQARRASRSLLLLGHKRFGTASEEPVAALESLYRQAALAQNPSETTLNYLFQRKAQALARATNMWSQKQVLASGSPASSISSGKAALAQFQSAARKVGADEVGLLTAAASAAAAARATSPSSRAYSQFKRAANSQSLNQASSHQIATPGTSPVGAAMGLGQHFDYGARPRTSQGQPRSSQRSAEYQALRALLMRAGTTASEPHTTYSTSPGASESIMNRLSALVSQNTSTGSQGRVANDQFACQQQTSIEEESCEQQQQHSTASLAHQTTVIQRRTSSATQSAGCLSPLAPSSSGQRMQSQSQEHTEPLAENSETQVDDELARRSSVGKTSTISGRSQSSETNRKRRMLFMKRAHEHHQHVATESTSSVSLVRTGSLHHQHQQSPSGQQQQPTTGINEPEDNRLERLAKSKASSFNNDCYARSSYDNEDCSITISDNDEDDDEQLKRVSLESQQTCRLEQQQQQQQSCKQPRLSELRNHRIQIQPPSPTSLELIDSPSPVERRPSSPLATSSASSIKHPQADDQSSMQKQQPQICLQQVQIDTASNSSSSSCEMMAYQQQQQQQQFSSLGHRQACGNCSEDPFNKLARLQRGLHERAASTSVCADCSRLNTLTQRFQQLADMRHQPVATSVCVTPYRGSAEYPQQHQATASNSLLPLRPRMSSMFVPMTNAQADNFAILSTLGQKKSKSAEDVAYLSSLVLQIWTGPEQTNPLLKNVSSSQNQDEPSTCWLSANKRKRRQNSTSPTQQQQQATPSAARHHNRHPSTSKSSTNVSRM